MKKIICITVILMFALIGFASAQNKCATIQSGNIVGADGAVLKTGYNTWGYNYQARIFNGMYCDAYQNADWCQEYADINLIMKWNDAWLSNKDCDGDGKLDRHFGFLTYKDSGAWLTNHMSWPVELEVYTGEVDENEEPIMETITATATYFVKIKAVKTTDVLKNGVYYTADGMEIGPAIWGEFAIIQEITEDPTDPDAVNYVSPVGPGLGRK